MRGGAGSRKSITKLQRTMLNKRRAGIKISTQKSVTLDVLE